MAGPLLFALPAIGALTSVGPKLAAKAIEQGGDIKFNQMPATVEARAKAESLMDSMRENARAIQAMKKGL